MGSALNPTPLKCPLPSKTGNPNTTKAIRSKCLHLKGHFSEEGFPLGVRSFSNRRLIQRYKIPAAKPGEAKILGDSGAFSTLTMHIIGNA